MSFWSRWKRTLLPDKLDSEIEEELRYHLAMQAQEESDSRAARLRFSTLTKVKEETRARAYYHGLKPSPATSVTLCARCVKLPSSHSS